ncbi:hypothetical protein IE53DRAFT_308501 [Violaceomyces palustris]|uniref:Uncharacterized protein n=1 Tax=Violaceomyces palustris TaxID=1673888 RepID=A0ACD0P8G1_9BASI|nr:hypothetical protein IE53DRAFT_308501 [Violaceomyces palustris]
MSPDEEERGGGGGGDRRRSSSNRASSGPRPQIKLKMKAAGGAGGMIGQGPKTKPYMQGYDRELDSEDDETGEGMAFEEQLILRMPEGPDCEKLREMVGRRAIGEDVWFKFKDSRRAVFHVGNQLYSAKLVDLPSIIESHKTLDNRQMFKICDISQMLLVEDPIKEEAEASSGKGFNIEDFIYPHGITPPMTWARKRRFRKRAPKRAIETVEKEVERLLKDDKKAEKVEYEFIDPRQEEFSEDEFAGSETASAAGAPSVADTPMAGPGSDDGTQMGEGEEMDGSQVGEEDEEGSEGGEDDDVDQDLAAELDAALEEEDDGESASGRGAESEAQSRASDQEELWDDEADGENEGDDDDEEDEDEDEDEDDEEKERRVRESQLEAECREIEALVKKKQADVDGTMNMLIKNRHQIALRKLTTERDIKRGQLADIKQARKERKEANAAAAEAEEEELREKEREKAKEKEEAEKAMANVSASAASAKEKASVEGAEKKEPFKLGRPPVPASFAPPSTPANKGMMAPPPKPSLPAPPTPMDLDRDGQAGEEGADDDEDDLWDDGGDEDES